ncbi:hypothetical protein [Actinoplanes sp. NPDC051851]|uniref:hypothetical protein n=1 Tax=Actinoplanes sp. NPDC051851 TaxID=3154753 RepID=UPI003414BE5A
MATSHGKKTVITVATKDISPFTKTSSYERSADVHDVGGYGADDKVKAGGQRDAKFTCGGTYDNTASTGPRNALHANVGTTMAVIRKVEGTGTGLPQDAFSAVLTKYVETNPADDYVSWSAEFEISGAITTTTQA